MLNRMLINERLALIKDFLKDKIRHPVIEKTPEGVFLDYQLCSF